MRGVAWWGLLWSVACSKSGASVELAASRLDAGEQELVDGDEADPQGPVPCTRTEDEGAVCPEGRTCQPSDEGSDAWRCVPCAEANLERTLLHDDPDTCPSLEIRCDASERRFVDGCGCGCEPRPAEPPKPGSTESPSPSP